MGTEYFYINPGTKPLGPVTGAQLIEMARKGLVHEGTKVVEVNGTDWRSFEAVFGDDYFPERIISLHDNEHSSGVGPELNRFVLLTAVLMPPLGIPALVFLAHARTAQRNGDRVQSQKSVFWARQLAIAGCLVAGLAVLALVIWASS